MVSLLLSTFSLEEDQGFKKVGHARDNRRAWRCFVDFVGLR